MLVGAAAKRDLRIDAGRAGKLDAGEQQLSDRLVGLLASGLLARARDGGERVGGAHVPRSPLDLPRIQQRGQVLREAPERLILARLGALDRVPVLPDLGRRA